MPITSAEAAFKNERGLEALEQLLTDRLRSLDPTTPETLTTRHNLAHWKRMSG